MPPGSEIIIVEDGSSDRSLEIVHACCGEDGARILIGRGAGAAAALNDGISAAKHEVICQIDQDVILDDGWFERVVPLLEDRSVGAVQGRYAGSRDSGLLARCAALDLSARYAAISGTVLDHACTGNSAYRAEALRAVGLFDESLGYGYDNDLSYRLAAAGFSLRFAREATAAHAWPATLRGFMRQQFGVGYGRLDVVAKHPRRARGDAVSGPGMIAHAAGALAALVLAPIRWPAAVAILVVLAAERTVAAVRAWRRFRDRAAFAFPLVHLLRDIAWTWAIVRWTTRRLTRRRSRPADSMSRAHERALPLGVGPAALQHVAVVIPALNERAALPSVIADLRAQWPELRIIVVDDGSDDDTFEVALRLRCEAIRMPVRLGVGSAVRAGLRHAQRLGYDAVVRLDGDGQHSAADVPRMVAPVLSGAADAVSGARTGRDREPLSRAIGRKCLSAALTLLVGRRVADPTSGFWAFGPRATRLLAVRHPTGYPEPELHLLLRQEGLVAREVPISSRPRIAGRTSLTAWRAGLALGRTLLAMIIVPLRPSGDPPR